MSLIVAMAAALAATGARWGRAAAESGTEPVTSSTLLRMESIPSSQGSEPFHYWLYLPPGFEEQPDKRWPMIMFLHGSGAGRDIQVILRQPGPLKHVKEEGRDFPFVIVGPQARDNGRPPSQSQPQGPEARVGIMSQMERGLWPTAKDGGLIGWPRFEDDLLALVDEAVAKWRVDPKRVCLTGPSMGGMGTFYMATHHPERWVAAAPISGGGVPSEAARIGQMPIWIIHGGRDTTVPVARSRAMYEAIDKAGGRVRFSVDENAAHDIAPRYYAGKDLYDWFLNPVIEPKRPPRVRGRD